MFFPIIVFLYLSKKLLRLSTIDQDYFLLSRPISKQQDRKVINDFDLVSTYKKKYNILATNVRCT